MDPLNIQHVWVGLGGTDAGSTQVIYSPDAGTDWYNVSYGLPAHLPLSKMIFQEGTAGVVYCATEAGIYVCDFSSFNASAPNYGVQWVCFNTGAAAGSWFPNVFVTDMKINYCQGKLLVATYGRSIWASDLYEPSTIANPTTVISTNTIFPAGTLEFNGSIDIQTGATLTISDNTILMPKSGSITVEPGARLVVKNSVLTNDCGSCFWQGIVVKGTGAAQTVANQGSVAILNSTIQHAVTGVSDSVNSCDCNGGIIQAQNSVFLNNHSAVLLNTYNYSGAYGPNLSYFYNCTFNIDDNYKGDHMNYPMPYHVKLYEVNGVVFAGCKFLNQDTNALDKGMGEGIYSSLSSFSVWPYTPVGSGLASTVFPRFCGLRNGLDIEGIASSDQTINISQAFFDSVGVGVLALANNNVTTTSCSFKVGNGTAVNYVPVMANNTACLQNIGIYTKNTAQFTIESNQFLGKPNATANWYNYGVVADNTGASSNVIYSNVFDSLVEGVCAVGKNWGPCSGAVIHGLQVLCNQFAGNNTDIMVLNDGLGMASVACSEGMDPYQGNGAMGISARNTFSGSTNNIVNTWSFPISYYYDTANSLAERPSAYLGNVTPLPITAGNTCPAISVPTGSGGGAASANAMGSGYGAFAATSKNAQALDSLEQAFLGMNLQLQISQGTEAALMDLGNPDSLDNIIATDTMAGDLYQTLLSASPYLSQAALTMVADYGLLSYAQFMNVLEQNPDDLHDNSFLAYLQDNDYYLTNDDLDSLTVYGQNISARTQLEGGMMLAQTDMGILGNIIISALKSPDPVTLSQADLDSTGLYYLTDPNIQYSHMQDVDKWLQNIGGDWSYYARMGFNNAMGNYGIVNNLVANMPFAMATMDADKNAQQTFTTLYKTLLTMEQQGGNITQLTPGQIGTLDTTHTIVSNNNPAEQMIVNITHLLNPGLPSPFAYPCFFAWNGGSLQLRPSHPKGHGHIRQYAGVSYPNVSTNSENRFTAYPNPTGGQVTFNYNLVGTDGLGVTVAITNVLGETVFSTYAAGTTGSIPWNSSSVPAGIYTYTATCGGGLVGRGKLVVLKR